MPRRYFREKLQVLIPLCLLEGCAVDALWKAHKRMLFGNFALVLINQSLSLSSSCYWAALRKTFLQSSVRIVKLCRNQSFTSLGCAVVIMEQVQKCWRRTSTVGSIASGPGHVCCWVPAKLVVFVCYWVFNTQLTHALMCSEHACYWTWDLKAELALGSCNQVRKSPPSLRTEGQHGWL